MVAPYPPLQMEQIKHIIMDSTIRRLTNMETHNRLLAAGITCSVSTVKNYKAQFRSQAQTWINKLAKSKRADYISQYRERIQEVEAVQRKLWQIIGEATPRTQVEACAKLLDCTSQLIELYDSLPIVNAIRDYDSAEEYRQASQKEEHKDNNPNSPT